MDEQIRQLLRDEQVPQYARIVIDALARENRALKLALNLAEQRYNHLVIRGEGAANSMLEEDSDWMPDMLSSSLICFTLFLFVCLYAQRQRIKDVGQQFMEKVSSASSNKVAIVSSESTREEEEEEEENPLPTLHEHIIEVFAEKMLFTKPYCVEPSDKYHCFKIDITKPNNPYANFMGAHPVLLDAMMAQFAKMKRIDFTNSTYDDGAKISFYRNKDFTSYSNRDMNFFGPYLVPKQLVSLLIDHGKLRLSTVQTSNYLEMMKKKTVSANTDDVHATKKRPIEVFATLFLDKYLSEEEIAANCELNLERLEVFEPVDVIEANLHSLFALNPVELELTNGTVDDYSDTFFFCSSFQINIFVASRTKKITFIAEIQPDSPIEDFALFGTKWQSEAHFLINCCPSLEQLEFWLEIYFPEDCTPEHILQHCTGVVNAARHLLGQLDGGSEQLRVSVHFDARCGYHNAHTVQMLIALDSSNIGQQQQLFTLGTPIVDDEREQAGAPYIARSITIVDTAGRPHLCKLFVD